MDSKEIEISNFKAANQENMNPSKNSPQKMVGISSCLQNVCLLHLTLFLPALTVLYFEEDETANGVKKSHHNPEEDFLLSSRAASIFMAVVFGLGFLISLAGLWMTSYIKSGLLISSALTFQTVFSLILAQRESENHTENPENTNFFTSPTLLGSLFGFAFSIALAFVSFQKTFLEYQHRHIHHKLSYNNLHIQYNCHKSHAEDDANKVRISSNQISIFYKGGAALILSSMTILGSVSLSSMNEKEIRPSISSESLSKIPIETSSKMTSTICLNAQLCLILAIFSIALNSIAYFCLEKAKKDQRDKKLQADDESFAFSPTVKSLDSSYSVVAATKPQDLQEILIKDHKYLPSSKEEKRPKNKKNFVAKDQRQADLFKEMSKVALLTGASAFVQPILVNIAATALKADQDKSSGLEIFSHSAVAAPGSDSSEQNSDPCVRLVLPLLVAAFGHFVGLKAFPLLGQISENLLNAFAVYANMGVCFSSTLVILSGNSKMDDLGLVYALFWVWGMAWALTDSITLDLLTKDISSVIKTFDTKAKLIIISKSTGLAMGYLLTAYN